MLIRANLYINCHNPIFLPIQIYLFKKFNRNYDLQIYVVVPKAHYYEHKKNFDSNEYNLIFCKYPTLKQLLLTSIHHANTDPSIFVEFDIVPIKNINIRNCINKEPMDTIVLWPSLFMWEYKEDFNTKFLESSNMLPFRKQFDMLQQNYLRDLDHQYDTCSNNNGFRIIGDEFLHFHNRNAGSPISGLTKDRLDCWYNLINNYLY